MIDFVCKVCTKSFKNLKAFTAHLHGHKFTTTVHEYYDKFFKKESEGLCKEHNNPTKFVSITKGYQKNCGRFCGASERTKSGWNEVRKEKWRKIFNPLNGGRPKGSKNKNPYPEEGKIKKSISLKEYYKNNCHGWTGKKHKLSTKKKMSDSALKRIERDGPPMAYKGKYKIQNIKKYAGNPNKITYRSLWERSTFRYMDFNPNIIKWCSEGIPIKYISIDRKKHIYFPDIYFEEKFTNGKIVKKIIEIKPKKQTQPPKEPKRKTKRYFTEQYVWGINNAKWQAAKEFCDFNKIEFEIWTEHTLRGMGIPVNI